MVKQLNLTLDDDKFDALVRKKGERTWREFIDAIINEEGGASQ